MSRHKLSAAAWPAYRRLVLIRVLPLMALAVGAGSWISIRNQPGRQTPPWAALLVAPVLVGVALRPTLRHRRLWFDSFELELEGTRIVRRQAGTADLVLQRADVTGVVEGRAGGMTLLGRTRFEHVGIPSAIEGYTELTDAVRTWAPAVPPAQRTGLIGFGTGLATIVLFVVAFTFPNPAIGASAAAVLAAFLMWAFVEIRRSLQLDRRTRRASWWVALPVAALVVRIARFLLLDK